MEAAIQASQQSRPRDAQADDDIISRITPAFRDALLSLPCLYNNAGRKADGEADW